MLLAADASCINAADDEGDTPLVRARAALEPLLWI
jgi:hypothetical protein